MSSPATATRPTLRQALVATGLIVVMLAVGWGIKDQVLAAGLTMVLLGVYLAHWFWRHRYS